MTVPSAPPSTKSPERRRYAVLFGYDVGDDSSVGYLRICKEGERGEYGPYAVVDSAEAATRFPRFNYDAEAGFWSPDRICEFVNSEPELSGKWRFHAVGHALDSDPRV